MKASNMGKLFWNIATQDTKHVNVRWLLETLKTAFDGRVIDHVFSGKKHKLTPGRKKNCTTFTFYYIVTKRLPTKFAGLG